jgi:hypothetical protein
MVYVDTVVQSTGGRETSLLVEPSPKVMADKGVSMGRLLISSRAIGGVQRFPLTNFSSTDQFIPAGMVVGKILLVDQVVEDIRAVDPVSPKGGESLPFISRINPDLSEEEKGTAVALLERYSGCFAKTPNELGRSNLVKHKIDTGEHLPLHQPPYASAWRERDLIEEQTRTMLKNKVAVHSNSPWASPVVLVRKKDGEWRFCVDYRRLNSITTKDVYPLPRIDDALSRLEGSRYFSILDMQAGYWQVEVDEQDRAKTAFITADGLYEFRVMPFGLTNAPATFQRMMDVVLAGLKWNTCLVYLDDIVVFAPTVSQHLERLETVLQRIDKAGLKLKLSKCSFLEQSLKVLGYIVNSEGLSPDPAKIAAVHDFPTPRTVKEVQGFLGLCSYYRKFVPGFAVLARALSNLTKKAQRFVWGEEQQRSFETLKTLLTTPPILAHPRYELPMEVHCDASQYGIGAVLVQQHEGKERVLAYASRLLSSPEINYSVSEKECLALVWSLKKFRTYIWGLKVKVVTDHHSLCWLFKKRDLAGRLARWSLQLQDLDIDIVHRSGRLHSDADSLSRAPIGKPEEEEEIPLLATVPVAPGEKIDMGSAQRQSAWWRKILRGMEVAAPSKQMRKLIQPYEVRGGVLYRRQVTHGGITYQLCLPESCVEQVLLACHDDVTAGHLGVTKTTYKIQQRYYWPKMRRQIVRFVLSCIDCQTKKRSREAPAGLLRPIQARRPFEKVGIDLIGPFPLTSSGNKHAIVAVDYLTKWAICKAVPAASSKEVVDFFVRNVVLQHGAPVVLISDRGKCLTASFAEELFQALQTNHLVTAAYHPQCNGLVERYNHTFAEMLSMYVNSYHNDWDGLIDFVTFA